MEARNPWGPPERAAAREDAIYEQYLAEVKIVDQRFATQRYGDLYLQDQYGHPAVVAAIKAVAARKIASK